MILLFKYDNKLADLQNRNESFHQHKAFMSTKGESDDRVDRSMTLEEGAGHLAEVRKSSSGVGWSNYPRLVGWQ